MRSPLPVRDGVNATRLRVPLTGPWTTVLEFVLERFGHVDPEGIRQRFADGEVAAADGTRIRPETPLGAAEFIWYYRSPPVEPRIPFEVRLLHEDERLVVADKPPFLPTTPGGRFLQETALVRLRRLLDEPELTPLHRLDRLTWGVVLFVRRAEDRGAYQQLFERRRIEKSYEALAPAPSGDVAEQLAAGPVHVRNRLNKVKAQLRAFEEAGPPNAHSEIELVRVIEPPCVIQSANVIEPAPPPAASGPRSRGRALYRLTPHTGKTHQLRLHMAGLGLGIENDPFYPTLLDEAPDDHSRPLGLLARSIAFEDPFTDRNLTFRSRFDLERPPPLNRAL